jgi:hypothetical protein
MQEIMVFACFLLKKSKPSRHFKKANVVLSSKIQGERKAGQRRKNK